MTSVAVIIAAASVISVETAMRLRLLAPLLALLAEVRSANATLASKTLGDDEKEQAARSASLAILQSTGALALRIGAVVMLAIVIVVVGAALFSVSVSDVIDTAASPAGLAIAVVSVLAAIAARRLIIRS